MCALSVHQAEDCRQISNVLDGYIDLQQQTNGLTALMDHRPPQPVHIHTIHVVINFSNFNTMRLSFVATREADADGYYSSGWSQPGC